MTNIKCENSVIKSEINFQVLNLSKPCMIEVKLKHFFFSYLLNCTMKQNPQWFKVYDSEW